MKVFGINCANFNCNVSNIAFRAEKNEEINSAQTDVKNVNQANSTHVIEPKMPDNNVINDYNVKVPQSYKLTNVNTIQNGLKLYQYKLANGYKVTIVPMEGSPAVVKTYVNVGSMNETPDIKGISHFLEHMAFNGTNGNDGHIKLESGDSFKKIDKLGGWTNASTNYSITDYVNSTSQLEDSDLEMQIKVQSAMIEDLKLSDEMIAKEKGPVSSEINMILDNPQTIAVDQTVRTLFNVKSPADELVGGSIKHIQNLTRQDIVNYYNKYYTPDNMNIVITGDVNPDEAIALVAKNFTSQKTSQGKKYEEKLTPINQTIRKDFYSDKAVNSAEICLGFTGPQNMDARENLLYRLAANYLYSENAGISRKLKDLNTGLSIDSEKISTNPYNPRFGYATLSISEDKVEEALHTIFDGISKIPPISEEELQRLKNSALEAREDLFDYSQGVNSIVGNSVLDNRLEGVTNYNEILESITTEDINNAVKKYFDIKKTAITVVHPKEKNNVSFKGHSQKLPIHMDKVEEKTLDNNFNVGFHNTNSNNMMITMSYSTDTPSEKKAGVRALFDEICNMGTKDMTEAEFDKYQEDKNINIELSAGIDSLEANVYCNSKNCEESLDKMFDVIYNPRLTEENLEIAKKRIKDRLSRMEETASSIYNDYNETKYKYHDTPKEVLENIDNLTLDDLKDYHKYVLNNSRATLSCNLPVNKPEIKDIILNKASKLPNVKPNEVVVKNIFTPQETSKILTKEKNSSQAEIKEIFSFKCDNSIKESVSVNIMNSILSNSSIGLFDNLREKQNLAYSVYSDIDKEYDIGKISLNILTTTDNKETGEQSFDNVQKSINGFNSQISALVNGEFTDEDLENAKRSFKASLLSREGYASKVYSIGSGMNSLHGIDHDNKVFNEIDNITKADIIAMAKKAFSNKPVYAVVATQDTLDANKDYLNSLCV